MISRLSDLLRITFDRSGEAEGVAEGGDRVPPEVSRHRTDALPGSSHRACGDRSGRARRRSAADDSAAAGRERDQARHRAAAASRDTCRSSAGRTDDRLWMEVRDNGGGLHGAYAEEAAGPASACRTRGRGSMSLRRDITASSSPTLHGGLCGPRSKFPSSAVLASPPPARRSASPDTSWPHHPTRVLIVDDEPLARERLRMLLQDEAGHRGRRRGGRRRDGRRIASRRSRPTSCSSTCRCRAPTGFDVIERRRRRQDAVRRLRHRLRPLCAARVRRARARLPAQAVRSRALPPGARRARDSSSSAAPAATSSAGSCHRPGSEAGARRASIASSSSRAAACSSCAPTRSTGSRRPATTSSCTSATTRTCSARR